MRLRKIEREFEGRVSLEWHPFALRPQLNPEPFEFPGSYVERAWQGAAMMSRSDGISFRMWDRGPLPRWSMPGLFAGAAARRQGPEAFHRFHTAMFAAFFNGNHDITQKETAIEVARQAQLDLDAFARDYAHPTVQESVRKAVMDAYQKHEITAVPTVLIGGKYQLQGAVPAADYLRALADCGLEIGAQPSDAESPDVMSSGWVDLGEMGRRDG